MQNQKSGQKMPLYQSADGKLYFNFAVGLSVLIRERVGKDTEEYTLTVKNCRYDGTTEYYDVERDGEPLPFPQSANRVKYLVSRYGVKTLAQGERRQIPLLLEEVKDYYESREYWHLQTIKKAEALPEYRTAQNELAGYNQRIGFALAHDRTEEAAAMQGAKFEAQRRVESILRDHGINPQLLAELPKCERCGSKGYLPGGKICNCAINRSEAIKNFCAWKRRKQVQGV